MTEFKFTREAQGMLAIAQIVVWVIAFVWIFAFMRADVNSNTKKNAEQDEEIENVRVRSADTYVRRDVFNEQYRQIMEKLNELDTKLDERNNQ